MINSRKLTKNNKKYNILDTFQPRHIHGHKFTKYKNDGVFIY